MAETERPEKLEVELSPGAEIDLDKIEAYLVEVANKITADRLIDQILDRCEDLADMPRAGRARDEIAPDVRSVTSGNYVIYYRLHNEKVEILGVLHGSRDLAAIRNDLT